MQNRALGAKCRGDAGQRVGKAWTGRRDHAAQPTRLARISVGRVGGGLLVAHVDDANVVIDAAVVDVDDVAAAKREDRVDTLVLEGCSDEMAAGNDFLVPAFPGESVFCRGGLWCRNACHVIPLS